MSDDGMDGGPDEDDDDDDDDRRGGGGRGGGRGSGRGGGGGYGDFGGGGRGGGRGFGGDRWRRRGGGGGKGRAVARAARRQGRRQGRRGWWRQGQAAALAARARAAAASRLRARATEHGAPRGSATCLFAQLLRTLVIRHGLSSGLRLLLCACCAPSCSRVAGGEAAVLGLPVVLPRARRFRLRQLRFDRGPGSWSLAALRLSAQVCLRHTVRRAAQSSEEKRLLGH